MKKLNRIAVTPSSGGIWKVYRHGARRALKRHTCLLDAVLHGAEIARREKGRLYLHRRDGTVEGVRDFGGRSRDVHVVPRRGKWAVKVEGDGRPCTTRRTKNEALGLARKKARETGGEVIVHDRMGAIRDSESYGKPPAAPREKVLS